eukprot:gene7041-135_t
MSVETPGTWVDCALWDAQAKEAQPPKQTLPALPAEVLTQLCRLVNWRDVWALENASRSLQGLLAGEPLLWATQILKQFPKDAVPEEVLAWLSSPLAAPCSWKEIFMAMRRVRPAALFMQHTEQGVPVDLSPHLVDYSGSSYPKVLSVKKSASFHMDFGAMPPGKYLLLCRMRVVPNREACMSFSTRFSRKGLVEAQEGESGTASVMGPSTSDAAAEGAAAPNAFDHSPDSSSSVGSVGSSESARPPSHPYVDACPDGRVQVFDMNTQHKEEQVVDNSTGINRLAKKLTSNMDFMMGSYKARWMQVGRQQYGSSSEEETCQSSGRAAAAPVIQELLAPSKIVKSDEPDNDGWRNIPMGKVTVRSCCKSMRITFVCMSARIPGTPYEPIPAGGSVLIDYLCLRPDKAGFEPLSWLSDLATRRSPPSSRKMAGFVRSNRSKRTSAKGANALLPGP